jgi:hypothetical protein
MHVDYGGIAVDRDRLPNLFFSLLRANRTTSGQTLAAARRNTMEGRASAVVDPFPHQWHPFVKGGWGGGGRRVSTI